MNVLNFTILIMIITITKIIIIITIIMITTMTITYNESLYINKSPRYLEIIIKDIKIV